MQSEFLDKLKSCYSDSFTSYVPYCSGIAYELPTLCGLEIKDFGRIALPITDNYVDKIRDQFSPAPFGKGFDTIIDEKVRKTLELPADKFSFQNTEWDCKIQSLVKRCGAKIGSQNNIIAVPYKLLLYEEGSYFLPHQDTEKEKGMFATLVIQLPSIYTGGELVMHFRDGLEVCDLGVNENRDCEYHNFYTIHYADLKHEIKPITSGIRLAVTYSVCWKGPKEKEPSLESIINNSSALLQVMKEYNGEDIYFPLSHEYTESSIEDNGIDALKCKDRTFAEELHHIQVNSSPKSFELYIMIGSHTVNMYGDGYGYGYGYDKDDINWEANDYNTDLLLYDTNGDSIDTSYFTLPEEFDWEECEGEDTDVELYTGNEGASKTTVYCQSFLVIVPVLSKNLNKLRKIGINKFIEKTIKTFKTLPKEEIESQLTQLISSKSFGKISKDNYNILQEHIKTLNNEDLANKLFALHHTELFKSGISNIIGLLKPWENSDINNIIKQFLSKSLSSACFFINETLTDDFFMNSDTNTSKIILTWIDYLFSILSSNEYIHNYGIPIYICSLSSSIQNNFTKFCSIYKNISLSVYIEIDKYILSRKHNESYKKYLRNIILGKMNEDLIKQLKNLHQNYYQSTLNTSCLYYLKQANEFENRDDLTKDIFYELITSIGTDRHANLRKTILEHRNFKFSHINTLISSHKNYLQRKINDTKPVTPWKMPSAVLTDRNLPSVLQFLRSNAKEFVLRDKFTSVITARRFRLNGSGFSVTYSAGGRGSNSFVTITKIPEIYSKNVIAHREYKTELNKLNQYTNDNNISSPTIEYQNEMEGTLPLLPLKRDGSELSLPPAKKQKITEVIDLSN